MVSIQDLHLNNTCFISLKTNGEIALHEIEGSDARFVPVIEKDKFIGAIDTYLLNLNNSCDSDYIVKHMIRLSDFYIFDDISNLITIDQPIYPIISEEEIYLGYITKSHLTEIYYKELCSALERKIITIENEYEAILDSSQDGIHVTDGDGITIRFNKACERIDNVKKDSIMGKNMSVMVEKGIYSESVALKVKSSCKSISMMQEVNGKQIMATGTPIFNNGLVHRIVVNSRDVTELNMLKLQLENVKTATLEYKSMLDLLCGESTNDFIAYSNSMRKVLDIALRIAPVDSTILIQGESGVGKGVLSSLIHNNSPRKNMPFMKIDCGAIPEKLLESELFGYEKGAFTGASEKGKAGLIELAEGGTLFLDEIGELSLPLQAKLLSVLQDRKLRRVGGKSDIPVNIRIIAATNKNLVDHVKNKLFREDLYYRLNVIPIYISPLRDRKEDLFPLISSTLSSINKKYGYTKSISPDAIKALIGYNWPGNVRELENIIERMVIISNDNIIGMDDIPEFMLESCKCLDNLYTGSLNYKNSMEQFEINLLTKVKRKSSNTLEMSKELGIDRSTVRRKMNKYNIEYDFE